ncbi:hypothetical protein PsorP6_010629 [Peronosclerospora sorghi]|uniref:Uncharacterized protein n=1 Tax=Peronosclerospora sorghi TaxID=230839 RepID=A0ACC0VUA5_9STRA|nr:hypothetical protein PsorP6_010629 [Peronosclerospora sorghi]
MLTTGEKIIEQAREISRKRKKDKKYYDKKRANMEFKEGDLVLLSTENLNIRHQTTQQTTSTSKKFIPKWIGPYKIIKKKRDNVVQLGLPPHMELHSTINIDKLKPYWKY